ncbi:MAG: tRNA dimethylallyltransferase [Clostridia bacterium 62_21]|nr:MAG: tRNA dimethylallyltransferase [Clostridia bacterium 62_21]
MDKPLLPLVVICGPTATGKTEVGILVAGELNGEVVSADSMMVYRGMDIGTAKPTLVERRGVPHHLIDVVEPHAAFSVALYQELAEKCIADIHARGRLPLLVGGTGLYIRSVIDRYRFVAAPDPDLRRRLVDEARLAGPDALHARLAAVDPAAAARIHPHNVRRVIRALEVYHQTGQPITSFQEPQRDASPKYRLWMFGLTMPREELYRRIEERVDRMLAAGLVDEVRRLLEGGYHRRFTAMQALGYKEIAAYLEGESTFEEAVRLLKRNTRRFAKRQLTWFRRDPRIRWLDVQALGGPPGAAKEIVASVGAAVAGVKWLPAKPYKNNFHLEGPR